MLPSLSSKSCCYKLHICTLVEHKLLMLLISLIVQGCMEANVATLVGKPAKTVVRMSIKYVNVSYHLESWEVWDAVSFLFEKIVVTKKLNQCYEQLGCNFLERDRCQLAHSYSLRMIESDSGLCLLCVWLGIYLGHLETRLKKVASGSHVNSYYGYCQLTLHNTVTVVWSVVGITMTQIPKYSSTAPAPMM